MINLGVDFGVRRIAVACADPGHENAVSYEFKKSDRGMELNYLEDRFQYVLITSRFVGDTHLWIEGAIAAGVKNLQTTVALAATQGAIIACHGSPTTIVPVSTWKKGVCGHGGLTKEGVEAWLLQFRPDLYAICRSQDERDAMCMSLYGIGMLSGEILVPAKVPKKRKKKVEVPRGDPYAGHPGL